MNKTDTCLPCIAAALAAALLSGCAAGPNFRRPAPPAVAGYTAEPLAATASAAIAAGGREQRFVMGKDIPQQWWELFKSPPLNALIEESLKANPTIDAAKAALRQARENVAAQKGLFYPAVQASGSTARTRDSAAVSPVPSSGDEPYSLHTAQVSVSYAPDLFGGARRQVESLAATAEFQRFQLEAARLALTSNVVAAAIQEASLRSQISAARNIIRVETEMVGLLRRQLAQGYASGVDVAAQEAALALAEQTLPPLQKQLAQTRDLLAALAGRFPGEEPEETFAIAELTLPEELPVSLPSRLVEQRPDVRAAEEQIHAASAQVGVAVAARLPQITLSADRGYTSTRLSQLFTPGAVFWTVAAGAAQTIFDGGTLRHKKRAAEAALAQAEAQYRGTVIAAFQNVADALHALKFDADALKAAVASEQAAKRSLDLARRQFELGYVSALPLLFAEQTYQQAANGLVQAQANRFADTAALFMALGGGWWNSPDVASAAQTAAPAGKPD